MNKLRRKKILKFNKIFKKLSKNKKKFLNKIKLNQNKKILL